MIEQDIAELRSRLEELDQQVDTLQQQRRELENLVRAHHEVLTKINPHTTSEAIRKVVRATRRQSDVDFLVKNAEALTGEPLNPRLEIFMRQTLNALAELQMNAMAHTSIRMTAFDPPLHHVPEEVTPKFIPPGFRAGYVDEDDSDVGEEEYSE